MFASCSSAELLSGVVFAITYEGLLCLPTGHSGMVPGAPERDHQPVY